MSNYVPRAGTNKKQDQLYQREFELQQVIAKNFSFEKLIKAVEKYRAAYLSLLKAKIHMIKELGYKNKPHNYKIEDIECDISKWENKTVEDIINYVKDN
jgi:hypothetical protein